MVAKRRIESNRTPTAQPAAYSLVAIVVASVTRGYSMQHAKETSRHKLFPDLLI
jgi:hypothetical protein